MVAVLIEQQVDNTESIAAVFDIINQALRFKVGRHIICASVHSRQGTTEPRARISFVLSSGSCSVHVSDIMIGSALWSRPTCLWRSSRRWRRRLSVEDFIAICSVTL